MTGMLPLRSWLRLWASLKVNKVWPPAALVMLYGLREARRRLRGVDDTSIEDAIVAALMEHHYELVRLGEPFGANPPISRYVKLDANVRHRIARIAMDTMKEHGR